jgi:hypothetical protein
VYIEWKKNIVIKGDREKERKRDRDKGRWREREKGWNGERYIKSQLLCQITLVYDNITQVNK